MSNTKNKKKQEDLSTIWEADDAQDVVMFGQEKKTSVKKQVGSADYATKAGRSVQAKEKKQTDKTEQVDEIGQAGFMPESRFVSSEKTLEETCSEKNIRPKTLDEYLGQSRIKDNLGVLIAAAKQRSETLDHLLLSGPPGLGKTTLAGVVANELGVNFKQTSGSVIERPGDLAAILTNLEKDDLLFIDEIHRLNRVVEEVLYPAMEDFALDIVVGQGPSARSIRLDLPHFTLVAATTRTGLLTGPLRDRFGVCFHLDYYTIEELRSIVLRSARIMKVDIDVAGADEIAARSRATPRLANRLLKRVRDYAQVRANGRITKEVADEALTFFKVDSLGLDSMDNAILQLLVVTFEGKPVGLNTIASALGEEPDTIEDVYEPYLLQQGLIARTARGRQATRKTYEHLGVEYLQKE